MKKKKAQEASITQPLLKDLIAREKAATKINLNKMQIQSDAGSTPLETAALFQDPGNGFNKNFDFPQD